jgi:hypothetical protein
VDAHETCGIQTRFDTRDGLLLQMFLTLTCQCHVIVLGLQVVQLGDGDQRDPRAIFNDQSFEKLLRRTGRSGKFQRRRRFFTDTILSAFECRLEPFPPNGLQ